MRTWWPKLPDFSWPFCHGFIAMYFLVAKNPQEVGQKPFDTDIRSEWVCLKTGYPKIQWQIIVLPMNQPMIMFFVHIAIFKPQHVHNFWGTCHTIQPTGASARHCAWRSASRYAGEHAGQLRELVDLGVVRGIHEKHGELGSYCSILDIKWQYIYNNYYKIY